MPARDVIFRIIGEDAASPAFNKAAASAEGAAARMSRSSEKMAAAGRKLTMGVSLPLIAIGAASIHVATEFNSAMTRIQTQAGGSAKDVKTLSREVLNLKSAQQGPVDLADSLYHLKSVGMSNVQAMKALRQSSDLAAVGHANLEDTTNALAGAWRTGIVGAKSFHQAVQTLNAGIGAGNMSMTDLVGALGTGILPTAKTFGLTLKDVVSSLALFTDEGVPADAAATRLRMSMSLLGAPSAIAEKHLKTIGLTGLKLANDMRKPNGMIVAIGDLKKHLDESGLSASKQSMLLSHAFGGGRSSSAILSMLNNYDVLQKKQAQVTRGMAKYNADVKAQAATPEAQFKTQIANLERAGVILGTQLLPAAASTAHEITGLVQDFTNLSPATRGWLIDAAKVAIVVGPAVAILGRLGTLFIAMGTRAKRAALFMAAPFRDTATEAAASAARIEYVNAQTTADNDLTAAAVAKAKAAEAQAAEDAAIRIAVAAEQEGRAFSALATQAAESAIEINAALQSEAVAAERTAVASGEAATASAARLATATAGVKRGAFAMQSAMSGAMIGSTVGMMTRNASDLSKALGAVGSAAAGAAVGWQMGGPWGAAIGGATGLVSDLATAFIGTGSSASRASQEAQAALKAQNAVANTLLGTLQSVNGAYNGQYKAQVIQQLQQHGILNAASTMGLKLPKVVSAAMHGGSYFMDHLDKSQFSSDQWSKLSKAWAAVGGGAAKAEKDFEQTSAAAGKTVVKQTALAAGVKKVSDELKGLGTHLSTEYKPIKGLAPNTGAPTEDNFNNMAKGAPSSLQAAQRMYAANQEAQSATTRRATAIIEANIAALGKHATKMAEDGASIGKASSWWRSNTKALENQLLYMGFNSHAVDKLFKQYSNPPKPVKLQADGRQAGSEAAKVQAEINRIKQGHAPGINANTKAGKAVLAQLQHIIDGLHQDRTPSINADPSGVRNAVSQAQDYLNSLHNKDVYITTHNIVSTSSRHASPTGANALATGGFVRGPGTGTSDSIPAWLSNGEYVIPAAQTARHRRLLDAIVHGGAMPGYARGGLVGGDMRPMTGGRGSRTLRLHIDLGEQLGTYVRDVVIDEMSYEAGRL